jgi:hypothetical protein
VNVRCPLPARASFRDLLRDLLGRAVQVRPGPSQELRTGAPAYLAAYRFDDGVAAAAVVTDFRLSAAMAAAIAAMPPQETWEEIQAAGSLEGDHLEFLHEVVNVSAKLMNSPTTPHVVLRELAAVPGQVPADIATLATEPRVRHDWTVTVDGYGEGSVTLLG